MLARVIFILLAGLLANPGPAVATILGSITPAEMQSLPPLCKARFGPPNSSEWKYWSNLIGKNFEDIHHYCDGLNWVNRYWKAETARDRTYYLQQAIGNFDYVIRAEKPDFNPEVRAEVYLNRGDAFLLMRKPGEAQEDFNKALSINPKTVKAYLKLADLHVSGKATARALETITQGLRHVPDSMALQRRYLELGGKKPFPEPYVAKAEVPQSAPQVGPPSSASEQGVSGSPAATAKQQESSTAPDEQPIGAPNNPYCRFCPPQ